MRYTRRFVIAAGAAHLSSYLPHTANAQGLTSSTVGTPDLTDDLSRAQLFDLYVVPAGLQEQIETPNASPLALPPVFYFPDDAKVDKIEKHLRQNALFGIDVSHYTNENALNFSLFKSQYIRFCYVKASQAGSKDPKFSLFWAKLKQQKITRGAYHFLSSGMSGFDQANIFSDLIEAQGGLSGHDLPPVIDLEWDVTRGNPDRWRDKSEKYIIDSVNACVERIKIRLQREPIIYTSRSWFGNSTIKIDSFNKLPNVKYWWADYNDHRKLSETPAIMPGAETVLWQFTDRALIKPVIGAGVDASIFYGTENDFVNAFGLVV